MGANAHFYGAHAIYTPVTAQYYALTRLFHQ